MREDAKVNLRTPLRELTIIHGDVALHEELRPLEDYVKRELNVKEIHYSVDEGQYVEFQPRPNRDRRSQAGLAD